MKRIILLFVSLCFFGCKDFLENTPTDFISPENYYNTEKELSSALTGVYDVMGDAYIYGKWYQMQITVGTDETYMTGVQPSGELNTYQHSPSNTYVRNFWRYLYFGIERANNLIANINKPKMDETKRAQILGEALFLRAYYYFVLVSHYGDVPLQLIPNPSTKDVSIARTDSKVVYEYIINDMKKAEELLSTQTASSLGFGGRVSLSTVRGILARVFLNMAGFPLKDESKYNDAIIYANKVIDSKEHALNPSYQQIFINYAQDKYDVKESIWEVEFWGNRTGNAFQETGNLGNISGPLARDPEIGVSTSAIKTTGLFFKAYEVDENSAATLKYSPDLRRDWNCVQYGYGTATSNPGRVKTVNTNIYNMDLGKWRREYETLTPKHTTFTPQNFPLLRYADVLLMMAEAENEVNGPTSVAIKAVNDVRKRGYGELVNGQTLKTISLSNGGSGYTTVPTVTITGGGGTGATATAVIAAGKITRIAISNYGKNFTSAPVVTITGGNGTGAIAVASIMDASLTPAQTASKEEFRKAIQKERMLELGGEFLRKQDLIRWGLLVKNLKDNSDDIIKNAAANRKYTSQAGDNVTERDVLLPIPEYDISLNKLLTPNPGW
jgi:hypothetical protein